MHFVLLATTLNAIQVIVLSLLQGVAELFPISSLGHTVIVPPLLHWKIDQTAPAYLAFVVMLHFGTATALLIFYWRDWWHLLRVLFASLARGKFTNDPDERFIWMIIVGTVPAIVLALLFQDAVRSLFGNAQVVAIILAVNGVLMLVGERLRRRQQTAIASGSSTGQEFKEVDGLGWGGAVIVGLFQSLALFPGISRSGATMVGGLALGLRHHAAMRYTFMLATPIIIAATVKTAPDLIAPAGRDILGYALLGYVLSGAAAFFSVRFLDRYFETNRLDPFAYYCLAAGIVAFVLLQGVKSEMRAVSRFPSRTEGRQCKGCALSALTVICAWMNLATLSPSHLAALVGRYVRTRDAVDGHDAYTLGVITEVTSDRSGQCYMTVYWRPELQCALEAQPTLYGPGAHSLDDLDLEPLRETSMW